MNKTKTLILLVDACESESTINLPSTSEVSEGSTIVIKKVDNSTNRIFIRTKAAETIDVSNYFPNGIPQIKIGE